MFSLYDFWLVSEKTPASTVQLLLACFPWPLIIARQWLSKYIPVAMNTHTTIEELLDTVFSVVSKESRLLVLSRTKLSFCLSLGLPNGLFQSSFRSIYAFLFYHFVITIWQGIQIVKLIIMQLSPAARSQTLPAHFLPLTHRFQLLKWS
jgi:hypothetical protein